MSLYTGVPPMPLIVGNEQGDAPAKIKPRANAANTQTGATMPPVVMTEATAAEKPRKAAGRFHVHVTKHGVGGEQDCGAPPMPGVFRS